MYPILNNGMVYGVIRLLVQTGRSNMSFQPLGFNPISEDELIVRAATFQQLLVTRRSVRQFSKTTAPMRVIENVIMTVASAPSGAN